MKSTGFGRFSEARVSPSKNLANGGVFWYKDTLSYRWFLGYNLLDEIPHFATVSYAFCKRFPEDLATEIFEHILNKTLNNKMLDPSTIFIDGTHIKASANKKKFQKEMVAKTAKIYDEQLRKTERGKKIYARRKETIERVFGDAKEKHAMRYTQHRGLTRVTQWVRLKFAAMNLKKLATWAWNSSCFCRIYHIFATYTPKTAAFVS